MKLEDGNRVASIERPGVISDEERSFFVKLGKRIAELRRQHALTQTEFGEKLGLSHQAINSFEHGTRRVPVSLLPSLARLLDVSIEELVAGTPGKPPRKRGPPSKFELQIEAVRRLPRAKQKFVTDVIDGVLAQVERSNAS